jgi:hypothetical protein
VRLGGEDAFLTLARSRGWSVEGVEVSLAARRRHGAPARLVVHTAVRRSSDAALRNMVTPSGTWIELLLRARTSRCARFERVLAPGGAALVRGHPNATFQLAAWTAQPWS